MTQDPNAPMASLVDRYRVVYRYLSDDLRRLRELLPRSEADAARAVTQRAELVRFIGERAATPEVGAEIRAQYAADFQGFEERIAEPNRIRAQLAELPEKIQEARRALARAERDAGVVPANPWGASQ